MSSFETFVGMAMSEKDAQDAILGLPPIERERRHIERCIERIRAVVHFGGNVEVHTWDDGFEFGIEFAWKKRDERPASDGPRRDGE